MCQYILVTIQGDIGDFSSLPPLGAGPPKLAVRVKGSRRAGSHWFRGTNDPCDCSNVIGSSTTSRHEPQSNELVDPFISDLRSKGVGEEEIQFRTRELIRLIDQEKALDACEHEQQAAMWIPLIEQVLHAPGVESVGLLIAELADSPSRFLVEIQDIQFKHLADLSAESLGHMKPNVLYMIER